MRSDWIFLKPMAPADYPSPPYGACSWGRSPYRSKGHSRVLEADTTPISPWPDTSGVTWEDQLEMEVREIGDQYMPRLVTAGDGDIGKRRVRYRCWNCYPSHLASQYRHLPWSFMVSLSAPAGCFEDWWAQARILYGFVPAGPAQSVAELLAQPFWLGVFAEQPSTGEPHAHLVVGNVNRESLDQILARWPAQGRFVKVKPIYHAWGAIHYCLSQTRMARKHKGESEASYYNRVKNDHLRGQDALLMPPFHSNLDVLETIMKLRQTVKRSRPKTPEAIAQARRLIANRWPIYWHGGGVIHRLPLPLDQTQRKIVKLAVLFDTARIPTILTEAA